MKKVDHARLIYDLYSDIPINELDSYKQFLVYFDAFEKFESKLDSKELKQEFYKVLEKHTGYYIERKEELVKFTINFVKKFYI